MTKENQPNIEKLSRIQVLVFMGVTALILLAIAQIWQRVGSITIIPLEFTTSAFLQGTILAILEPIYEGHADTIPPGSVCAGVAYTSRAAEREGCGSTVSPRIAAPHKIANTGMRKVTELVAVAPLRESRWKKIA